LWLHTEPDARSALGDSAPADNWASTSDEVAYEFVQTDQFPRPYAIGLGPHKARWYTLGVGGKDPSGKRQIPLDLLEASGSSLADPTEELPIQTDSVARDAGSWSERATASLASPTPFPTEDEA